MTGNHGTRGNSPHVRRGRRRSRTGTWLRLLGAVACVGLVVFLYVFVEVTTRFEGQLWKLPSVVYSEPLLLHPGDPVEAGAVTRRLLRCGYAETTALPTRAGEFRRSDSSIDVQLRPFEAGRFEIPVRGVSLRFSEGRVESITELTGRRLARVEFEPEILATLHGSRQEQRDMVDLSDVPHGFVQAVLAAEDVRFFDHHGVDPFAVFRAAAANLRRGRIVQGGSTITQQEAKNLFTGQERTWWRKLREAVTAFILDARYPKGRILEVYLNDVYLGQRGPVAVCGVQAGSRFYFGRDLRDLTVGEWALLAGLIRNPGGCNPFAHPREAVERRDQVLHAMERLGWLAPGGAAAGREEPLRLGSGEGGFRGAPYVTDLIRSQLLQLYSPKMIEESGLRIFTTIDTLLQENAEDALREGLSRLEREIPSVRNQRDARTLQGCLLATDPRTGSILALVGGRDYRISQFNRVVQARRQPGSCFKPFVYLAGFSAAARGRRGLTPASLLQDEPLDLVAGGERWRPENYDGLFRGPVTVRRALEESLNVPAVQAAREIGLHEVVATAERCGFPAGLRPLPSLSLGAQEVTPLDLAVAYGTLAARGRRASPTVIREVLDASGRALSRRAPENEQAVSAAVACVVTEVLRGVVTRGTASSAYARGFRGEAAGKTGTTDDLRDAWFVGYTPEILALTWVGYDDNFRTGLTGASGALPIWVDFMMRSRRRWGSIGFTDSDGVTRVVVDAETGQLASQQCPSRVEEIFVRGTEPTEECSLHGSGLFRWFRRIFGGRRRSDASSV